MLIHLQLALLLFLYKALSLLTGLAMVYMGYKLFLADKVNPAGDISVGNGKYALSLKGGAPGIFFSLFGTILVYFSIYRGLEYDLSQVEPVANPPSQARTLPSLPPKDDLTSPAR